MLEEVISLLDCDLGICDLGGMPPVVADKPRLWPILGNAARGLLLDQAARKLPPNHTLFLRLVHRGRKPPLMRDVEIMLSLLPCGHSHRVNSERLYDAKGCCPAQIKQKANSLG